MEGQTPNSMGTKFLFSKKKWALAASFHENKMHLTKAFSKSIKLPWSIFPCAHGSATFAALTLQLHYHFHFHSCFQHSLQHAKLAKSTSFNNWLWMVHAVTHLLYKRLTLNSSRLSLVLVCCENHEFTFKATLHREMLLFLSKLLEHRIATDISSWSFFHMWPPVCVQEGKFSWFLVSQN